MLTNNEIKHYVSLKDKKNRIVSSEFIAEGRKLIEDLYNSGYKLKMLLVCNPDDEIKKHFEGFTNIIAVNKTVIEKISNQKNPQGIIGILEIPVHSIDEKKIKSSLSILLDNIQDPGNLGTIIRTADWYGIEYIFCSPDCVDVFNPKVVQATMGSIAKVKVIYTGLPEIINKFKNDNFKIYGTFLSGKNIYNSNLQDKGFIILGNEGNGISESIEDLITDKLLIPRNSGSFAESLNVSAAAAILCSEFKRQQLCNLP